ncbi:unnamed protein product [Albugo candida]|uniref:Uncharacterized protein n=3 Tax=Albugo candida TaxID=65357 RepID=A0A024GVW1_9STRA|nr:unnamed protein product [Albugo candida]|eukprot:CCI50617.1 unnamed protein product [Albugo candida]
MKISIIFYMLQQAIGVFGNNPECAFTGLMICSWEETDGFKNEFTIRYISSKRVVYCDNEPNPKEMTFDTSPKSGCEYAVTFKKDFVFFKEGREEETKAKAKAKARAKASTYELLRIATIVSRSGVNFGSHQISFDLDKNAVFEMETRFVPIF